MFSLIRYGMMYGVPDITSSRVPGTRPARPSAGCSERCSTAVMMRLTIREAAAGLSRAMYSASEFKFASALRTHLTRTAGPLPGGLQHLLVRGKFAAIGFGNRFLRFLNLPVV